MKAHQYLATSIATLLATMGGQRANALPQGEAVAHGKANFKRDGGRMEIRASDRAVINFRGFNIDRNEAVTFVQPGAKARVLNRVTDGNPTRIFGQLKANGQVTLVNPSGVFFQNGAMVNVGGIIAAAGNISDADFLAGRNRFTELTGEVNNAGTIRAKGDVSLLGAHVSNSGIIHSGKGLVSLVAGDEVLVGERGGNVYVSGAATPGKASKAGVSNTGKIVAKKALLGAGDFYSLAVQHSGEIRAEEVAVRGGKGGRVEVSGKIDASARGKGKKGGRIEVTGETVALAGAQLDASGDKGGGEVLVGGDWQGGGTVSRAQTTTVDAATVIQADAVKNGAGGKVVVWADGATQFDGRISARGLGAGRAGGQVETSGKLTLGVGRTARVDAGSPQGKMGNWLLDPTNLTIAAGGTGSIGGAGEQVVDASVINTAAATVILTATNNITFGQSIAMTKAGAGLTATAGRNIEVNGGFTITTNNGEINFTADSDQNGTGFIQLGVGSKLTTKGAGVNLTVDHGSATSTDGIKIFGDIDTRTSPAGVGKLSKFQVKGSAQTGAIEVGAVTLNAGSESRVDFDLYADEINLTGGPGSVKGTGFLNLRPASLTTNVKVLAADDLTAGQLDITRTDLAAISNGFTGVSFGRSGGEGPNPYTGTLVIGDTGGASWTIDRGAGRSLNFDSGPNGVISHVEIQAGSTSYVTFRGDVINVKGVSAPTGRVSFYQHGNSNVEVLNMNPLTGGNSATVPGTLRLDNKMLESVGNNSKELEIGNEYTSRSSNLTFFAPVTLNASAGLVLVGCGGKLIFNAPIDAGKRNLEIRAGDIEFNNSTSSLIKSLGDLVIRPSGSDARELSRRSLEVYGASPSSALTDVLTLKRSDLLNLASNFSGELTLGSGHTMIGGDVVINASLDFSGKKITGLTLTAPERVLVNQSITMGSVGATATKQNLELNGREVEIQSEIKGAGTLTICPVVNSYQPDNPLNLGMLVGTASHDVNHLTITADEYAKIGAGFRGIIFGRAGMTGDLEVRGSALTLKANTELQASSGIKLHSKIDGAGQAYWLWARGLEVDVENKLDAAPKSLTNLSGFYVNTLPSDQLPNLRKIVVNGTADLDLPGSSLSLDLTESDLSWIDGGTVRSVVIGFDNYAHNYLAAATSTLPIEVMGGTNNQWTLPTNTELRSSNRIYREADIGSPAVYGSMIVRAPIDGAGYNLTLRSDSELKLLGGPGSITNVGTLTIAQHKLDVPIRLLEADTYVNRDALVLSETSCKALGSGIGSLYVGRTDSKSDLIVSGDMSLVTNTTLTTGTYNNPNIPPAGTGGLLRIDGDIDGNKTLTLNSFGTTQLVGSLGSTTALASFEITKGTDVAGVVQKTVIGSLGGSAVTVRTTGNQTFSESVELLSGGTLEAGGTLTVSQTLAAGANDLALLANEMVFSGAAGSITGTGVLTLGAGTPETNVAFYSETDTGLLNQLDLTRAKMDKFALGGFNKLVLGRANGTGSLSVKENFELLQETLIQTGGGALTIDKQLDGAQKLTLSSGSGAITAKAALGATTALGDLSVLSTGKATFRGAVNAASVFTDVGGTTALNGGTVTTSGLQDYNDAVVLGAATTLTSSGAGDININAGATGPFALNINTTGVTRLKSTVNVASVETNVGGSVELAANITTTGTQLYHEQAVLSGDTQLTGTTVTFDEALGGGGFGLEVTGNAQFAKALTSLSTLEVTGNTSLNGGLVSTSGAQTYGGSVTLGKDTTLTSTAAGNIALNGGASGGFALNINTSGATRLAGTINLGSITTDAGGTVELPGLVTTTGAQTYNDAAVLGAATTLTSTGAGAVALKGGASGAHDLAINTSGVTQIGGGINVGSITTDTGGTVKLSGDIQTTGTQSYGEQAELIGNTTLSGTTVSFANTIAGGSNSLGVTGNAVLNGAATGLSTLSVGGTTALNGGTVTTSGTQTYTGAVTLGSTAALTGSTVSFANTIAGGSNSLGVTGNAEFNGAVSGLSTLGVTGTTLLNTSAVTTSGAQTYGGKVTLGQDTALASTASGQIALNGGATSNKALAINTSGVTQLGGGISVGSIATDAGGTVKLSGDIQTTGTQSYGEQAELIGNTALSGTTVSFASTIAGGSNSLAVAGNAEFNGAVSGVSTLGVTGATLLNTSAVTTSGAQTYGGKVTLGQDAVLTSTGSGDVTINAGATGDKTLAINTAGVTRLGGGISVGSITTDAGGTVELSGEITTRGAQTYNDAATLTGATTLGSTGGGALALKGGAAGEFDLALNTSGGTQLAGGINVASLTTDAGGATEITADVTTTGAQTYGDAVQVSGPVALSSTSGGALTLRAGVDGAGSVSLATSGNVTVTGDSGTSGALQGFSAKAARVEVGGVQALGDVTLDASDLLVLQGASYKAGDTLSLNPTARAAASGRSSIVKPSGDVSLEAVKFVMGAGQKLVVSNGALSITAASGVVGDLAASVAMDLNVDQLEVVAREAGDFTNAGLKDLGLSMVSPKITFNGTLAYAANSTGAKTVVWNTANGAVAGKNNVTRLAGSGVGKNARMSEQFNSVDEDGYVLQPLALKPSVVIPPVIVDPVAPPLVTPEDPVPVGTAFARPVQFDLMNWSLGYRDETLERPDGIWVIRSLGINGRWDRLQQILDGEGRKPKVFAEL